LIIAVAAVLKTMTYYCNEPFRRRNGSTSDVFGKAVLLMLTRRYHMSPMQRCYW